MFCCGGSRNFSKFIHLFDGVFVLDVDLPTLHRRLDERPEDEWAAECRPSPERRAHIRIMSDRGGKAANGTRRTLTRRPVGA